MEAWQQRVIDEKAELDEKLVKLEAFLAVERPQVPVMDLVLLHVQRYFMQQYSAILHQRIGRFRT